VWIYGGKKLLQTGCRLHNCNKFKLVNASLMFHLFHGAAAGDFDSPVMMTFKSFAQFYHFVLSGVRKLALNISIPVCNTRIVRRYKGN
jgi:hypothetical protein